MDMDMDMDGKFHIHGNPAAVIFHACAETPHAALSLPYLEVEVGSTSPRRSYAPQFSWRSLQGFCSQG